MHALFLCILDCRTYLRNEPVERIDTAMSAFCRDPSLTSSRPSERLAVRVPSASYWYHLSPLAGPLLLAPNSPATREARHVDSLSKDEETPGEWAPGQEVAPKGRLGRTVPVRTLLPAVATPVDVSVVALDLESH